MVAGLTPHFAIPLSKAAIFGAAVGGYLVNGRETHPFADRPLIYYDLASIMQPPILLGTVLGVYLNVVFPEVVLVVMLIVVLSYASYSTVKKAFQLYAKENASDNNENNENSQNNSPNDSNENNPIEMETLTTNESSDTNDQNRNSYELQKMLKEEAEIFPAKKFLIYLGIFLGLLILVLAKGSGSGVSMFGIACGTWQYWLVVILTIPYFSFITYLIGASFMRIHQKRKEIGYEYKKGFFIFLFFF